MSLLKAVESDAGQRGIQKVTHFRLVVGEYSAVSIKAMDFALQHLTTGTILDGASYELVTEEARSQCQDCGRAFRPAPPFFLCPGCGRGGAPFTCGRELYIDYYEGE